jgi:hypothetical protein
MGAGWRAHAACRALHQRLARGQYTWNPGRLSPGVCVLVLAASVAWFEDSRLLLGTELPFSCCDRDLPGARRLSFRDMDFEHAVGLATGLYVTRADASSTNQGTFGPCGSEERVIKLMRADMYGGCQFSVTARHQAVAKQTLAHLKAGLQEDLGLGDADRAELVFR